MPRSQKHNDRIGEGVRQRYNDDPSYALTLSQKARERWNREHREELRAFLEEFEAGRLQRNLVIGLRAMKSVLDGADGDLDDTQKTLLRAVRDLRKVSDMYNAASSEARHEPVRGSHSHTHAAFDHPVHDDGLHSHEHTHDGDADHDPPHTAGELAPGRVGQTGEAVSGQDGSGIYAAEVNSTSPAERAALRRARQAAHEAQR